MIAEAVAAVRSVACTVLGFSAIPAATSLADADGLPTLFGAYEVGSITYEHGPAVRDYTAFVPVDFVYVKKRSVGVDTDALVLAKIDALSKAIQGAPNAWRQTYGILGLDVVEAAMGPGAFAYVLADTDSPYCAGRVQCVIRCCWGPYATDTPVSATWIDSGSTSTATITKNAWYPFDSKAAVVKTSGDVTVVDTEVWGANDATCAVTWTRDPYTSYVVTITVIYDGVTTVLTHTYAATSLPTATYEDSLDVDTAVCVASIAKSTVYSFTTKVITVKTSTDVVVSHTESWGEKDVGCQIEWTHNPIYTGYTVTLDLTYNGVTTTLTHNYGGLPS